MAAANEQAALARRRGEAAYWAPLVWAQYLLQGMTPPRRTHRIVATCYDEAAEAYDDWNWQSVWAKVEWPALSAWVEGPESILELGIGTGTVAQKILERVGEHIVKEYVGVDLSEGMLEVAKGKLGDRVGLIKADATCIDLGRKFDFILMCRIMGHVEKPFDLFKVVAKHLKPGGRAVVSDLDARYPYTATRVPTSKGKIPVPTFKHDSGDITKAADDAGLRLVHLHFTYADQARALQGPNPPESLRDASGPLSNIMVFEPAPL